MNLHAHIYFQIINSFLKIETDPLELIFLMISNIAVKVRIWRPTDKKTIFQVKQQRKINKFQKPLFYQNLLFKFEL